MSINFGALSAVPVSQFPSSLHSDQLVLLTNEALLITCGRMPSTSIRGNVINIANESISRSPSEAHTIHVSYYDSVLWVFSVDDCPTWFVSNSHSCVVLDIDIR